MGLGVGAGGRQRADGADPHPPGVWHGPGRDRHEGELGPQVSMSRAAQAGPACPSSCHAILQAAYPNDSARGQARSPYHCPRPPAAALPAPPARHLRRRGPAGRRGARAQLQGLPQRGHVWGRAGARGGELASLVRLWGRNASSGPMVQTAGGVLGHYRCCQFNVCHPCSCVPCAAQCQALVDDLKGTQLFNSCAHGRPTTAPLVDLQASVPRLVLVLVTVQRPGHCRAVLRPAQTANWPTCRCYGGHCSCVRRAGWRACSLAAVQEQCQQAARPRACVGSSRVDNRWRSADAAWLPWLGSICCIRFLALGSRFFAL